MSSPRVVRMLSALAIMGMLTAACGSDGDASGSATTSVESVSDGAEPSGEPIKIGVLQDKSGVVVASSTRSIEGLTVAADAIANGEFFWAEPMLKDAPSGILGRPIEFVFEDTQANPNQALLAVQKLAGEGVSAIIGTTTSPDALQAKVACEELEVPCIFPSLGDSQIVMPPNEGYAFTFPPSFALQATELAKAMDAAGQETIAIVQDDSGISELISKTFTAAFDDAGIEVTSKEVIPVNSQSVTSQVQRLGAADADAILDIVVAASLNALLVKEIDSAGLDATLYGINTLTDPQLRAQIGESIDGAISIDQIDRSSESFIEYSEYFAEQQGGDVEVLGHHIYATTALLVLKAAVESADSTDGPAIRDALQEISDFPAGFGQPGYTLNWKSDDHNGSTEAGIVFIEFDGQDITTWETYQPTGKE